MAARAPYFLSPQSYCCELDDGAIILELVTGTYIGIHAESLPDLKACIQNWPNSLGIDRGATRIESAESENLIADLISRGILTTSPTPERPLTMRSPGQALENTGYAAAGNWAPIMHLPQFAMALLQVITRHKDRRLASLIDWLRQRQRLIPPRGRTVTTASITKMLDSFFRLRIWFYTADRRCLFDSLVMAVFLTRKRIPCTFVIGVSTKPFRAHSWVQMSETVINDTPENVQMFTPILVIGVSD